MFPFGQVANPHHKILSFGDVNELKKKPKINRSPASIYRASVQPQPYVSAVGKLEPQPAVIINSIVYKHSIRCKQLS